MSEADAIPVMDRALSGVIAWQADQPVTAQQTLNHALALSRKLPDQGRILNLVRDRYGFTVGFLATVLRHGCTLLPPNEKPALQSELALGLERTVVLHDGAEVAPELTAIAVTATPEVGSFHEPVEPPPMISRNHQAIVSFTSGSTGAPQPIPKSWAMLHGAATLYLDTLIPDGSQLVATVPAQHMYGLELASLLPLWSGCAFHHGKPLFPADVLRALQQAPSPRVLITTPLHLRALLASGLSFPRLERILCATAPLSPALASAAETQLNTIVVDVYGCSEAGCMASRRLAVTADWRPLPGLRFAQNDEGFTQVHGPHLDAPVTLADRLEFRAGDDPAKAQTFQLRGREGDMVKIAGKRGSLGEITARLLAVSGVEDGVVFVPDPDCERQRVVAFFQGTADARDVRQALARTLDDAFIPRPLIQVDHLPRTDTSKLPRQVLLDLYRRHQGRT